MLGDDVYFEAFELAACNESVMSTKGRLRRSFPGCAVEVKKSTFCENGFQATLAQAIAKMSHQAAPGLQPRVIKAGQLHEEIRETTHPGLITECLMTFLKAAGKPASVTPIWKNTREDILWSNCLKPWQRSPLWLLVRVALQLAFRQEAETVESTGSLYKTFMIFFMAHVLKLTQSHSVSSDVLYAMNAKLSRRLLKLGTNEAKPWMDVVRQTMSNVHSLLESRWSGIIRKDSPTLDLEGLRSLRIADDTSVQLLELDDHISAMASRELQASMCDFRPSVTLPKYAIGDLPRGPGSFTEDYQLFDLVALESWVALHLSTWLDDHIQEESTCELLKELMGSYFSTASRLSANNPERFSIVLLTTMEIWLACDRSACHIHPLLVDYDPEIPIHLLGSLILPRKDQMTRLSDAEKYLKHRQDVAEDHNPSVFRSFGNPKDFSVRYFDQSRTHQSLLSRIEDHAFHEREEKRTELALKKEKYQQMMRSYDESTHQDSPVLVDHFNQIWEDEHVTSKCVKCNYLEEAGAIGIEVHEWPLPQDKDEAKATVFEISVPRAFSSWRDATVLLLQDVLGFKYTTLKRPKARYTPETYRGLSMFAHDKGMQRIGLLSEVKPHLGTHRSVRSIMATGENDVLLNNGLQLSYFDSVTDLFTSSFEDMSMVVRLCTYELPQRSSSLQKFLIRQPLPPYEQPPNEVIAGQVDCPSHMSLEEFKAFAILPLGCRIVWMNVLVQLASPSLDFTEPETNIMLLQSIYQAGPANKNIERESHNILTDERFCLVMLERLDGALQRVKESWESFHALGSFINLAARMLSLTTSAEAQTLCLDFLTKTRHVAFDWVGILQTKAQPSLQDSERADYFSRTVEVALICVSTFDLDQKHMTETLASLSEASVFIQCCILVQQYSVVSPVTHDRLYFILLERWKLLSCRTIPVLTREILELGKPTLSHAIQQSWTGYYPGSAWKSLPSPHEHWVFSMTASQRDREPVVVHFNLLTAELLVNGSPLTRLPREFENHPAYFKIFGRKSLEVMPSTMRGMRFSSKKSYAGCLLHFGMLNDELLLHATQNGQEYDLIPSNVFQNKFPIAFVNNIVHWYNHKSKTVEFRSDTDPWLSSTENWRLMRVERSWRLAKDRSVLLGLPSNCAQSFSQILSQLEEPDRLHMIYHEASCLLEIDLPRLQIAFHFHSGTSVVHSRQFRGMSIDPHQGIDTLVGLRSKLTLKGVTGSQDRIVLVPDGQVIYQKTDDHVEVSIEKATVSRVYAYRLQPLLGRVVDPGVLRSKLFLCYIHSLTSSCLVDPLTSITGTEQALTILKSAAVRSFDRLGKDDLEILERIARLTPGRVFYPDQMRVMQTIRWDPDLSTLSQHGGFYTLVKAIFQQAKEGKMFHPNSYIEPPELDFTLPDLVKRDLIRSSTFRVSDFGAEEHTIKEDTEYTLSRDREQESSRATRIYVVASMIFRGQPVLNAKATSNLKASLWENLEKCDEVQGPQGELSFATLKYDSRWLEEPVTFLGRVWCPAHCFLGQISVPENRFLVMMWLAAMAFSSDAVEDVLHTLAAFYIVPGLAQIRIPELAQYNLKDGTTMDVSSIKASINEAALPFHMCPEARLPTLQGESSKQAGRRRTYLFKNNRDAAISRFSTSLEQYWPCEVPEMPSEAEMASYFDVDQAMTGIRKSFASWFHNGHFLEYLCQIERVLQHTDVDPVSVPLSRLTVSKPVVRGQKSYLSLDSHFALPAPSPSPLVHYPAPADLRANLLVPSEETKGDPRLPLLLDNLTASAKTGFERDYITKLKESFTSTQMGLPKCILNCHNLDLKQVLHEHLIRCSQTVEQLESAMRGVLLAGLTAPVTMAVAVRQYPRLSPSFFLQQLTPSRWRTLPETWKMCILNWGLALTELHRAQRLLKLSARPEELADELLNIGHQNWSPFEHPEFLLLEVDSEITIRQVQEEIARVMRDPPALENAVMQLNMGEGKSSVIIPMVAAALADGSRLVRVVTARPQSRQMFQMLVSKLGGLLNRRIYHLPFSRALRLDKSQADAITKICNECMTNGGILFVQPEHILSFQLMGLECLANGNEALGRSFLRTQHLFNTKSRDIVDESDENFSVKLELMYTMGIQQPIELSPQRWTVIAAVLDLVQRFALEMKDFRPLSIEINRGPRGSFPRIRLLRLDAHEMLLQRLADHICDKGVSGFPIAHFSPEARTAILTYISKSDLGDEEISAVETNGRSWTGSTKGPLMLLRGLIAGGILAFVFGSKRWRVNYGITSGRTPETQLAVPYLAKDHPTLRSEFSHPEVVIILTSLSYYYGGMDDRELWIAFSHLLKSDQAQVEYDEWVRTAPELSHTFHQLSGVNMRDRVQCVKKVFPFLRYSKNAIDFYLSHIVFPKELKEFPHKLSASGWDIGHKKVEPTTGFSGTNDSRHILPLSVKHLDLPSQKDTNVRVLECLLQEKNSVAHFPPPDESEQSVGRRFLAQATRMEPPVRVILDVGAQIVELSNQQVAEVWLKMNTDLDETAATVFLNSDEELCVVDRKGRIEPLQTSPFAQGLDRCLVYLDEAHTRGTDLKLPGDYRAAVTLGANLTKDRLAQGERVAPSFRFDC